MPLQACEPVLKTLLSAAANAKQNLGMRKAKLVVSECFADKGPVLKRAQPRAQVRCMPWRTGWRQCAACWNHIVCTQLRGLFAHSLGLPGSFLQGRANQILKPMVHITVKVKESEA